MSCSKCGYEGSNGCSNAECPKLDVWQAMTAPKEVKEEKEEPVEEPVKETRGGKR